MPKSHIAAKIICYIRGVEIVETPEEKVRQEYARRLVEEFGYPKELIDVEVPIQLGRDESKRADIVVYRSKQDREKRENHCIIVECKELDIKFPDGEKQLKAYVNATTTQIGVWTNGIEFKYWKRLKEPDRYEEKGYLPKYGQEYGDKKILKKTFVHQAIYRQLLSVFTITSMLTINLAERKRFFTKSSIFYLPKSKTRKAAIQSANL